MDSAGELASREQVCDHPARGSSKFLITEGSDEFGSGVRGFASRCGEACNAEAECDWWENTCLRQRIPVLVLVLTACLANEKAKETICEVAIPFQNIKVLETNMNIVSVADGSI